MAVDKTLINRAQPSYSYDSTSNNIGELEQRLSVLQKAQLSLQVDNSVAIDAYGHSRDKAKVISRQIKELIDNNSSNDRIEKLREVLAIEQQRAITAFKEKMKIQMRVPNLTIALKIIRERLVYLKSQVNYEK